MMFWMALVAPLFFVQEPADDLRKEIEKLKKQNVELQERLSLLEQASLEDAQTIQRLRQVVKLLEGNAPSTSPSEPKNGGAPVKPDFKGPGTSIRGKLVYVDVKNNFITLGIGKPQKVEIGYKFEIYRETYEAGGESKLTRLGVGTVEKFMGQDSMTKVVINEGAIADMRVDDLAVAIRRISDTPAPGSKEDPKTAPSPAPEKPEPAKDGIYRITGRTGIGGNGGYVVNYGSQLGAHQTQLLYVYKDGQFKAKLRLDKVDKLHSIANVVDGTVQVPPDVDDQVHIKEINKSLAGKVALSDDKRGVLAVDLRQRDGIKPGMHLEVRRLGQKIGTVMITEVQAWGSWAKPDGDLKIEQIQKGDFVEAVEEK